MDDKNIENKCILAVDAGSTNVKAALLSYDGTVLISDRRKTPLTATDTYAEGNAGLLYDTVETLALALIGEAGSCEIGGVCIASQMTSLLCLDQFMEPVGNIIYGIDTRGSGYLCRLEDFWPMERICHVTGCPPGGIYWPGKLMWLREHRPEQMRRTCYLAGAKEYLLYRLTGTLVTDCASASTTQIYDQKCGCWWPEILHFLQMEDMGLPEIKKPWELAGMLGEEVAERLGIKQVPVLVGSGDGPAATISSGSVRVGDCCISFGTTAVTRYVTDSWQAESSGYFVQHLCDGIYLQGIRINESGRLAEPYIYATGGVEQSSEGAFFYNGRFFLKEPSTAGGRLKAVCNGVLFQIYESMLPVVEKGGILRILPTGGGSVNRAYMQRTANLFGTPVIIRENGTAFAGLASFVLMYEKKAVDLFDAVNQLSLGQEILMPQEDRELLEQFHSYIKVRGRKAGAGFDE